MPETLISSEEEAFEYLQKAVEGTLSDNDALNIKFDNWPILEISLKGGPFDEVALTSTTMSALIDLQTAVYHTYAQLKYKESHTGRLSKEEKDQLEIVVKVNEGSTILSIDLHPLALNAIQTLVGKMSPTEIIVTVLGSVALITAGSIIKAHLNNRKDIRLTQSNNEQQANALALVEKMSEQETKRVEIIAQAIQQKPELKIVAEDVADAMHSLLKAGSQAKAIEIQGNEILGETAVELAKTKREASVQIRKDGIYRVQIFDATHDEQFRVSIYNVKNREEFVAIVQDDTSNDRILTTIQEAIRSRGLVELKINARSLRGMIHHAVITDAYAWEGEKPAEQS